MGVWGVGSADGPLFSAPQGFKSKPKKKGHIQPDLIDVDLIRGEVRGCPRGELGACLLPGAFCGPRAATGARPRAGAGGARQGQREGWGARSSLEGEQQGVGRVGACFWAHLPELHGLGGRAGAPSGGGIPAELGLGQRGSHK